jgi:hypothetical protein
MCYKDKFGEKNGVSLARQYFISRASSRREVSVLFYLHIFWILHLADLDEF